MTDEPRIVRDARLRIREVEKQAELIHMSPAVAVAGSFSPGFYLRRARLALRQAERAFAKADDPRLEPLKPMRARLRDRRPQTRPRRKRYRCSRCFLELLLSSEDLEHYEGVHNGPEGSLDGDWGTRRKRRRTCGGTWEPVARRKPNKHG